MKQCIGPVSATPRVYLGTSSTGANNLSSKVKTTKKKNVASTVRRRADEKEETVKLNFAKVTKHMVVNKQTILKSFLGIKLQTS